MRNSPNPAAIEYTSEWAGVTQRGAPMIRKKFTVVGRKFLKSMHKLGPGHRPLSNKTQDVYFCHVTEAMDIIGARYVEDLDPVTDYIAELRSRGNSEQTIKQKVVLMGSMYKKARQHWGWDLRNPWLYCAKFAPATPRRRIMSEEEERRLFVMMKQPVRDMSVFMLEVWFRIGEVIDLTWDRVNEVKGEVLFNADNQKSAKDGQKRALSEKAIEIIRRQPKVCSYVFTREGQQCKYRWFKAHFDIACESAGIEDLTPHDLRRTGGQRALNSGSPVEWVAAQLGHSNTQTTQRHYAKPGIELAKKNFRKHLYNEGLID